MAVSVHRARLGKYIPALQTIVDYFCINTIFALLVWIHYDINFFNQLRLMWVLFNASFAPTAVYYYYIHSMRSIRVERLVSAAVKGVVGFAVVYSSLTVFIGIKDMPSEFFFWLYALILGFMPAFWFLQYYVISRYRKHGGNSRRVVIIGTGETARRIHKNLTGNSSYGYNVLGFVGGEGPDDKLPAPYLGTNAELDKIVKDNNIDTIYLTAHGDEKNVIQGAMQVADENICKFYYVPSLSHFVKRNFYLAPINGSMPALGLHPNPLQNSVNQFLKRTFDIVFSGTALLFLVPLVFLPVAIAVKVSSPGPVFFKQKRTGYRGRDFYCYKFRTMKVNADSDSRQATKNDDRKTRVGDFLRRSSIDELPQFWNVLKGNMSIVGPRPHMLAHTETYRHLIGLYMVRHLIKPGITGWAQINGFRGTTDELWKMEKRVDNDVWYIEHWSFFLDLKIIVKTVINAIKGEENAY